MIWYSILFFILGVLQDTIATLELIYCTSERIKPTLLATFLRSVLSLIISYWFVESDHRSWLVIPWVGGDLLGAVFGIKLRQWLDKEG